MEKNSKLLSVIVPVYKAEKYLHRCVDSILAQTWTNLEIILVDDGSPDRCGEICDEYTSKDSRVRVIHKPNGGVSSARNAGIDAATGDYIAFVDSDDYIASEMYEKLFEVVKSDTEIAVCDCYIHSIGIDTPKIIYDVGDDKNTTIANFLLSDIGGSCWNMVIPITLLSCLRFPEYLTMGEDYWFVLRVIVSAKKIMKVSLPLYFYCIDNTSSLTHSQSRKNGADGFKGIEEDKAFLIEKGIYQYVEKEWAWQILRFKSTFVTDRAYFEKYCSFEPEANEFVKDCPLLSSKMKAIMLLLDSGHYGLASMFLFLNKIRSWCYNKVVRRCRKSV